MEGRTEQGEGMVNVENLRRLAGTLEKMGEAKRRIMIIPREETGAGISEGEVEKLLEGEDERLIAKMKQAREEVDCHRRIVDGVWEQLGTKPFRHFFQELTGEKPVGQMGVGRTDLTIHLIMKKEEDMEVLGAADAREGKKVKLVWGGKVIGCVFDYLGRERNGWSVGGVYGGIKREPEKVASGGAREETCGECFVERGGLISTGRDGLAKVNRFYDYQREGKGNCWRDAGVFI